jgi:hypothetical protein
MCVALKRRLRHGHSAYLLLRYTAVRERDDPVRLIAERRIVCRQDDRYALLVGKCRFRYP